MGEFPELAGRSRAQGLDNDGSFTFDSSVSTAGDEPGKGVVDLGRGADTAAWRIRQLQFEARGLAREQLETFARDLSSLATRAAEIAGGGDAYPVGARELASRLAADLPPKAQLLSTLLSRET